MLSMKSRTSWPSSSRKYSAMVRPVRPTRARTPGGSFIWPKTSVAFFSTPEACISCQRSFPSRGALAHACEDREALVYRSDVADELLDDDGLPDAGAPVGADLPALGERRDQVDDLQARLQDLRRRRLLLHGGRRSVDGPRLLGLHLLQVVQGLPQHVEEPSQAASSDGHEDGRAGVDHRAAPRKALGGAQGQAAHPVVAGVLLHFQHQRLPPHGHLDRVQDFGHLLPRELHVHHGSDDLHHLSLGVLSHSSLLLRRSRRNPGPSSGTSRSRR